MNYLDRELEEVENVMVDEAFAFEAKVESLAHKKVFYRSELKSDYAVLARFIMYITEQRCWDKVGELFYKISPVTNTHLIGCCDHLSEKLVEEFLTDLDGKPTHNDSVISKIGYVNDKEIFYIDILDEVTAECKYDCFHPKIGTAKLEAEFSSLNSVKTTSPYIAEVAFKLAALRGKKENKKEHECAAFKRNGEIIGSCRYEELWCEFSEPFERSEKLDLELID